MSKLDDLNALMVEIGSGLDNIANDITMLMGQINPTGGLTEAEANEALASLTAIRDRVQGIADRTPDAPLA